MQVKKQFLAEISKPTPQIDIELCALLFASQIQTDLDVQEPVLALDAQVNDFLAENPEFHDTAPFNSAYLMGIVGGVLGYRGDRVEYFSADNSLFNRVIENRLGIPISLAAIYLSIGKRLGIGVHGVGFPGHFLIRIVEPDQSETVVDPFSHRIIAQQDFKRMTETARQNFGHCDPRWIENAHPHDVLLRMFENLKSVYLQAKDLAAVAICLDYQLMLKPTEPALLQQFQALIDLDKKRHGGKPTLN